MNAREQLEAYATTPLPDHIEVVGFNDSPETFAPQAINALREVLKIHQPDTDGDCPGCGLSSGEEPYPYPCDTAKAITTQLEGT